jgi:uncharacterized protein YdhG (YjbR/CyaY superfamily)
MTEITVDGYISALEDDRRHAMTRLRDVINANLPAGFHECINYGMPAWVVPHSTYPAGYHCDPKLPLPFLSIASQKSHIALYHMGIYADDALLAWFQTEWPNHVKTKLDMGKSCIRFKKVDAIPYDLIGDLCTKMTPQAWIERYEGAFLKK